MCRAFSDQVIADVGFALVLCVLRQGERGLRNILFRLRGPSRHVFHHVPIAVARGEVHARINAGRVIAQNLLGAAVRFEKVAGVEFFRLLQQRGGNLRIGGVTLQDGKPDHGVQQPKLGHGKRNDGLVLRDEISGQFGARHDFYRNLIDARIA